MNMKKIKSILLTVSLFALLTVAVPAKPYQIGLSKISATTLQAVSVVGTWEIDAYPDHQPAFKALGIFTRDGGCITSAHVDPAISAVPGYGAWERVKGHRYAFTFKQFTSNADQSLQYVFKVNAKLELSSLGNEFKGTFKIDVLDPYGNLIFSDTGTLEGKRIQVEE
jgi:hypothetical protein